MRTHFVRPRQITFVLGLCLLFVVPSAMADPDMIGHWALDDGLGTVAVDSAGTNDGLLVNNPIWQPIGRIGGALDFDGVDDLIDLGLPDYSLAPSDLTDQLTIALWIRADAFGVADARMVSRASGTAEQDHLWMVSTVNQTGLRFRLKAGGVTTTLFSAAGVLQAGVWHHVGAVYDGAAMRLYRDGLEVASVPKSGAIDTDPTVGVALGNQPPGAGLRPFDGQLDDVRLYRRALSPIEIAQLAFPDGNQPPFAAFTVNPSVGAPPLSVSFDASPSYDVDGSIVSYAWNFGDGTTGSGLQVVHSYDVLGNFQSVLIVTDDIGAATSDSVVITVSGNSSITIPFTHVVIDANPPVLTHCKAAGDVDGDGFQDVLAAGARGGEGFFWYHYPTWEKYTIVPPGVSVFTTDMAMGDVDGDGDLDAIIPKGFDIGNAVYWYENPRPNGDPSAGPWPEHFIGTAGSHDVEVGDIDKNGLLDVMVRYNAVTLFLQTAADTWSSVVVNTRNTEGLDLADLDNDGDLDAAINGRWLENPLPGGDPGQGPWSEHVIDVNWPAKSRVLTTDLDADGKMDVVLAGAEVSGERLSWYGAQDPVNGPWIEHPVAAVADYNHSLEAADMDLDGDLDLIVAEMQQSVDPDNVIVFRNEGGGLTWSPQVVATTGSHNMVVTDLEGDGDFDIIGANHAQPPLEMWRNELNPNAVLDLDRWQRIVADPDMPWQAIFVEPARVDADNLPDVVAGGWWYRNPGTAAGVWDRFDLGLPLRNMNAVHDFDGDGDLDVIGTEGVGFNPNSLFAWARNDGAGNFTIFENIPAGVGEFLQGTTVATFQPGGPQEVVLAWENGTDTQMLTVPEFPAVDDWSWRVAAGTSQGERLDTGDIDGDGDLDILQGTQWLRNDGGVWTPFVLFPNVPPGEPDRVYLIDVNRDGRLDALVGYEGRTLGSLSWYEQPAVATDLWTENIIDNPFNPQSLDLADMDLDGDVDLVMGEHNRANPMASALLVYENLDGFGADWRQHLVYVGDEHHDGTRLFDIEGDGDLDIVSIGFTHRRLMIYENLARTGGPVSGVPDFGVSRIPSRLVLSPPFPNPFNPLTHLRYELPTAMRVNLAVYDVRGRLVSRLVDRWQAAGHHEVPFSARGLASGVYLAHLRAGGQVRTMRMLLVK